MSRRKKTKKKPEAVRLRLMYPMHRSLFASVFVAQDDENGRLVAVKRYQPMPVVERPDAVEKFPEADIKHSKQRFLFELTQMASVSHDHIVRCLHSDDSGESPYFIMPLHPATLWNEIWVQTPMRPRPRALPQRRVVRVLRDCLEGLAHLHEQDIVHRDITPTNFFLGQGGTLRLGDLSMAKGPEGEGFTPHPVLGAQRAYMSPELFARRFELVDKRTDVFSIGVLAYRMITGKLPESEYSKSVVPPGEIDLEMDRALNDWIMAALERQPQDRLKDAVELLESLPVIAS